MTTPKARQERTERIHSEASALIELERVEREKKTAKLRELRLAKEARESPAQSTTARVKTGAKPTVVMMKAAAARPRKT